MNVTIWEELYSSVLVDQNNVYYFLFMMGFPDSSSGKESASNARDLGLILG